MMSLNEYFTPDEVEEIRQEESDKYSDYLEEMANQESEKYYAEMRELEEEDE